MASSLVEFDPPKGRGTPANPTGRFESLSVEMDAEAIEELRKDPDFEIPRPRTQWLKDDSQSIITRNNSPDLGFEASLNPYRGCEHGCSYCYARPYHEYLGFSAGLDFETRILVKENAAKLLEQELRRPSWKPMTLACSGVTDCYQPVERSLELTRSCLEVLRNCRHPVGVVTKNYLVTRDADHLAELAHYRAAAVTMSITTLDQKLAADMEPRASMPAYRLRAIRELSEAGIPVGVAISPLIPGLNDHEIPAILEAAADHGACYATMTMLRLPHGVKDIFMDWVERNLPGQRARIEGRIREMRGGNLNDSDFGTRFSGTGPVAEEARSLFAVAARRHGFRDRRVQLSSAFFRRPTGNQLELF